MRHFGAELNGTNVIYYTQDGGSCFVSNNKYEIFEVPAKENSSEIKLEGDFLILSHNIDFDYWNVAEMEYYIDRTETMNQSLLIDNVEISTYGVYQVTNDGGKNNALKKKSVSSKSPGNNRLSGTFDSRGTRKKAYKLSEGQIISILQGHPYKPKALSGGNQVEIYKKKNKKKN